MRLALIVLVALAMAASAAAAPDLIPSGPYADAGDYTVTEVFAPESCAVQEGSISSAGYHSIHRFATEAINLGDDLVLGRPSRNDPRWTWAECHGHYHLDGFAEYRLLDGFGVTVGLGHKQAFCIEDTSP